MKKKIKLNLVSKSRGSVNTMIFYFSDDEGNQYSFEAPLDIRGNFISGTGMLLNSTSHTRFIISTDIVPKGEKRFKLHDPRVVKELD